MADVCLARGDNLPGRGDQVLAALERLSSRVEAIEVPAAAATPESTASENSDEHFRNTLRFDEI